MNKFTSNDIINVWLCVCIKNLIQNMHRGLILVKLHQITSFHIFFNSLQGFTVLSGLYGNKIEKINTFQVNNLSIYIIGVNPNNHIYLRYNYCSYFSRNTKSKMYSIKVFCLLGFVCVESGIPPPPPPHPPPQKKKKIFKKKKKKKISKKKKK